MSKQKMEAVMYDLQLARTVYRVKYKDFKNDQQKEALFNSVLEKHGITQQILDSSLVYYSDNIELYMKINDSITSQFKVKSDMYKKMLDQETIGEEEMLKRYFPLYTYLMPDKETYSFNLDSFKLADINISTLSSISFDVLGYSSGVSIMTSSLFEYGDTTVISRDTLLALSDTIFNPLLSDRKLKNVSGYIRVMSRLPNFNILLYNIQLNRDSSVVKTDSLTNGMSKKIEELAVKE